MKKLISFSSFFLYSKKTLVFFVFILSSFTASSQNLVPNPSFEIYDTCPDWFQQISRATGWKALVLTPDFLHKCSNFNQTSIPYNFFGVQETVNINDNGYSGIGIVFPPTVGGQEVIGIKLLETLAIGTQYFFSFDYSCAFRPGYSNGCISNKLGMKLLTEEPVDTFGLANQLINNEAILYSDSILSDSVNWLKFDGSFIADSAYKFLAIGNFFSIDSIQRICYGASAFSTYYYIDNICLSLAKNDCNSIKDSICYEDLYIFPNPCTDELEIHNKCNCEKGGDVLIYNTIGQIVYKETIEFINNPIDLNFLARGVYFLKFKNSILKIILI